MSEKSLQRTPPATFALPPDNNDRHRTRLDPVLHRFFTKFGTDTTDEQLRTPSFLDHAADFTSNDPETTTNAHRRPNEHFTNAPRQHPTFRSLATHRSPRIHRLLKTSGEHSACFDPLYHVNVPDFAHFHPETTKIDSAQYGA